MNKAMNKAMNVVTIGVSSIEDAGKRFEAAFQGEVRGNFISFVSLDLMWKVLAPKRLDIVRAMTGAGPMTIREAARRVKRDVKAVHGDVHALLRAGVLDRTDDGGIVFPYDAIHVDFMITKAA
jgi:predicted transcriptional regulator